MKQLISALLLTCTGISLAVAADTPQGEKWKITSSMQMAGMSMPAQSTEVCKAPGDDKVPVRTEKNCEIYDVKRTGNTQTFNMRCTGKDAMEGSAEFTYLGKDSYKGKMQVKAQGETMTMAYEGQKLGACDGSETNVKAKELIALGEKQKAESEKMQAETCHKMAAEGGSPDVMKQLCKDPKDKETYCAAVQTHDKFLQLSKVEKQGNARTLTDAASFCGFAVVKTRTQLCKTAGENFDFLTAECPVEADALAKAQCAGRKYTSISAKYRDFCSSYIRAQEEAEANSPTGKAKGLLQKAKGLGGLFNK
jgi:uncharacterized protein DUF3617